MTSELSQTQPKARRARRRLPGRAAVSLTRLVLFWERLWPAILPALFIPLILAIVSLFDLWAVLPVWLHWAALTLSGAGFAALLFRDLRSLRFPSRREAQTRLEEDGKVDHAALQALDDKPSASGDASSPLWQAHLADMRERAKKARLKNVRATAEASDPWGLRYTGLGVLVVALVASGGETHERLLAGMQPHNTGSAKLVADLWIEPPDYANKAPIYLLQSGQELSEQSAQVNAPEGSVLKAQLNGRGHASLSFQTEMNSTDAEFVRNGSAAKAELPIDASGLLKLSLGGRTAAWPIGVIADEAPSVAYTTPPARTDDGRLHLAITIEDDYAVASAELVLRLDPEQERPIDSPAFTPGSLDERRRIPLEGVTGASGERAATLDLQADPWAGLRVLAKVVVTDGAGQSGETETVAATLPERIFYNPVAKAVIEQRQHLAVASADWPRVARAFDAVTLAPDIFYDEKPKNYLMLRAAFWRVMRQDGENFDDAVEKFWPLALQLEDEALELARQRLEAAQEALRQALERGASDEEINRLVEEMRQAMNDYLNALAQSGQPMDGETQRNAQQLDQSDLDEMLNSIRDLSQQGADNAARQMLSDLENLLNNLRLSQSGQGSGSGQGEAGQSQEGQAAGQAGELIGRQRELADEAFERGRNPEATGDDLANREGALGGDLDELMDGLAADPSLDPNGDAARALGRARSAMREAEGALDAEQFGGASDAMERAIDNLRDGAEALAREQMRQAQQGQGQEGERGPGVDPLGRPAGDAPGEGVEVPGEGEAGRTRAVIEELRRRLGQPGRDDEEKEYLERLLERF
ncbi:DUF4175 family protein [Hyphococcus flavus]|uniref:DUF4175 family protein n=1 Tax=Hyphococcus flavus TaxID=1866326 RepID=A0AAE9ZHR0_9PROT|nr:DUF4175 family protein [Hyphococcus flavus]WDI33062.1 DUF4175 family protein [Hyphococcus flavus]